MAAVRTFSGQTELIMQAAVEAVTSVVQQRLGQRGTDGEDTGVRKDVRIKYGKFSEDEAEEVNLRVKSFGGKSARTSSFG